MQSNLPQLDPLGYEEPLNFQSSKKLAPLTSKVLFSPFPSWEPPSYPRKGAAKGNNEAVKQYDTRQKKTKGRRRKREPVKLSVEDSHDEENEEAFNKYGFRKEDIYQVVDYIASCSKTPSDGILLVTFEAAIRKYNYLVKHGDEQEHAKRLLSSLEFFLKLSEKTPIGWFTELDVVGDGRVSVTRLAQALRAISSSITSSNTWTEKDINCIVKAFTSDTLGAQYVTEYDVQLKFDSLSEISEAERIIQTTGSLFDFLQQYMKRHRMRVVELFQKIDADGGGTISRKELADEILHIINESEGITEHTKPVLKHAFERNKYLHNAPAHYDVGSEVDDDNWSQCSLSSTASKYGQKTHVSTVLRESRAYLETQQAQNPFDRQSGLYQKQVKHEYEKYTHKMAYVDRNINKLRSRLAKL